MAQYFFDTSAAVKYYHTEAGTPTVSALFSEPGRKFRISRLGLLEIQAAFAMKVRSTYRARISWTSSSLPTAC